MTKTIGERVAEKVLMNFVDLASKRAAQSITDRAEREIKKQADKRKSGVGKNTSLEDEETIE